MEIIKHHAMKLDIKSDPWMPEDMAMIVTDEQVHLINIETGYRFTGKNHMHDWMLPYLKGKKELTFYQPPHQGDE